MCATLRLGYITMDLDFHPQDDLTDHGPSPEKRGPIIVC
jgi:hypothetical protein